MTAALCNRRLTMFHCSLFGVMVFGYMFVFALDASGQMPFIDVSNELNIWTDHYRWILRRGYQHGGFQWRRCG